MEENSDMDNVNQFFNSRTVIDRQLLFCFRFPVRYQDSETAAEVQDAELFWQ